ncbi:MAG: right-handed parallel beta-helix repeat-containing protein, partial [Bacteroidetes bacterium]|nr:right-handed parallel beta-helix repeat-containing protein [Bacteroidota bacterium]
MGNHSDNVARRRGLGFIVLLIAMFFGFGLHASAQTPQYYYDLATGGNAIPWNPISTTFQKWQGFYSANMFTGAYAGNITKVYFKRYSASTGTTYSNFSVSIGQSASTTFSTSAWFTPMTTALSAATYTIPSGAANTWFEVQLSTPVYYNPNQTLIIQICSSGLSAGTGITALDGGAMTSPNVGRLYGGPGCTAATPSGYTASYRQNFGFDLNPALPDDAGISELTSPVNFCAGQQDIKVKLRNYGTNTLSSVTVNWSFDGVPETPISYTTPLATLGEVELTLGSKMFASGVPHTVTAWTSSPNNTQDSFTANDSLSQTVQSAITGTYTIGGTAPDFATISQAADAITQFGLCGPAVFNIRSGTYNEQVSLGEIAGSSAVNTVTFQSESGNRADVTITSGAATGTGNNYVVRLAGADYVTFKNMTFTATNPTYGTVLEIGGGSENDTYENIDLNGVLTTSTSSYMTVVWSPSGSLDHNNTFLNCNFRNGSYGMYMYGAGTTSTENNLRVDHCTYTGQYLYPIYFYYMGQIKFFDNTVIQNYGYAYKYLMIMYYGYDSQIERNTFFSDGGTYCYGLYVYYDNYYQTGSSRIVNNFITCTNSTTYQYSAARIYYCNDMLFAHNTVYMDGTYASGYALYSYYGSNQRYLNNIVKHSGAGMAWYVPSAASVVESNFNNFFSNGPVLAYWAGNRANLLALQTASGMDQNSVSKDITFLDYSSGDLHLAAPSDDDND